MKLLGQYIEAMIFASEHPVSFKEISECLKSLFGWEIAAEEVTAAIDHLKAKYEDEQFSFYLTESGGGYLFMTKKEYYPIVAGFLNQRSNKRLSTAALETLSIIAYKQPITKTEIEQIRGVNCDYTIQKLLEKDLIAITGRADGPGKPLQYGTSKTFMDYFGINSTRDLPKLKEIEEDNENQIGEPEALMKEGEL
ncbi:MAG: SMC-Scp complex subunit ScpB [Chitinophagales bacterium]|nr:SMC-Scp complex subunit ScpB [Chitinophagales bacterium]